MRYYSVIIINTRPAGHTNIPNRVIAKTISETRPTQTITGSLAIVLGFFFFFLTSEYVLQYDVHGIFFMRLL